MNSQNRFSVLSLQSDDDGDDVSDHDSDTKPEDAEANATHAADYDELCDWDQEHGDEETACKTHIPPPLAATNAEVAVEKSAPTAIGSMRPSRKLVGCGVIPVVMINGQLWFLLGRELDGDRVGHSHRWCCFAGSSHGCISDADCFGEAVREMCEETMGVLAGDADGWNSFDAWVERLRRQDYVAHVDSCVPYHYRQESGETAYRRLALPLRKRLFKPNNGVFRQFVVLLPEEYWYKAVPEFMLRKELAQQTTKACLWGTDTHRSIVASLRQRAPSCFHPDGTLDFACLEKCELSWFSARQMANVIASQQDPLDPPNPQLRSDFKLDMMRILDSQWARRCFAHGDKPTAIETPHHQRSSVKMRFHLAKTRSDAKTSQAARGDDWRLGGLASTSTRHDDHTTLTSAATPPQEGFSKMTPPQERFSKTTPPQEGFSKMTPPQEGFSKMTPPQEGFSKMTRNKVSDLSKTDTPPCCLQMEQSSPHRWLRRLRPHINTTPSSVMEPSGDAVGRCDNANVGHAEVEESEEGGASPHTPRRDNPWALTLSGGDGGGGGGGP